MGCSVSAVRLRCSATASLAASTNVFVAAGRNGNSSGSGKRPPQPSRYMQATIIGLLASAKLEYFAKKVLAAQFGGG